MKSNVRHIGLSLLTGVAVLWTGALTGAQTEPLGGQPAPGSKPSVADLDYQVKYQRAVRGRDVGGAHGGGPRFPPRRRSPRDEGQRNHRLLKARHAKNLEALTGNNNTPSIVAFTDLRTGPVVLELRAATDKASLYGQIVAAWQVTVADVGPSGKDKGKGGKLYCPARRL